MRGVGAWKALLAAALAATLCPACGFESLDGLTGRDAQAPPSTNQGGDDSGGADAASDRADDADADAAVDAVGSDGPSGDTSAPKDGASVDTGGDAPAAVIAHVQNVVQLASGNTLTVTFGQGVAPGDLLVGVFHGEGTVTVSDNRNGAWTQVASQGTDYLFYAENTAPGHIAITVAASTQGSLRLDADEFSGVATASALHAQSTGSSTGTTWSAGMTSPIPVGELVYAWAGTSDSVVFTAGTTDGVPMTIGGQSTSSAEGTIFTEYALSSAAGAQDSGATVAPATMKNLNGGQVTFRP